MVELGHETTLPVTLDDIIHHCQAVCRGCRRPLLVADLPFGSFEASPEQAVRSATRIMKETNMDSVKVEGGRKRVESVRAIVDAGIAVMGHIGLTPQSFSRSATKAYDLIKDAEALQDAGVFAMVLECVPAIVAQQVAKAVDVPVIGIGAGPHTDGQVLVFHDMLGMMQHHHHAQFTPQFCKQYATVGYAIQEGLAEYKSDVEQRKFPDESYSPYKIPEAEAAKFLELVQQHQERKAQQATSDQPTAAVDDGPDIKVY
ncbi:3-methyl-2-oxobutanoate hydroxymethyltransferase 1 [Durusdinium trenchii]|uniref:3-methyl-2-oxobutanoate hydroxymethyltransferase n=1 Tax=Durusdinium trenchii TaxID=1381693 RepID=A0ABP0NP60_9DINO